MRINGVRKVAPYWKMAGCMGYIGSPLVRGQPICLGYFFLENISNLLRIMDTGRRTNTRTQADGMMFNIIEIEIVGNA